MPRVSQTVTDLGGFRPGQAAEVPRDQHHAAAVRAEGRLTPRAVAIECHGRLARLRGPEHRAEPRRRAFPFREDANLKRRLSVGHTHQSGSLPVIHHRGGCLKVQDCRAAPYPRRPPRPSGPMRCRRGVCRPDCSGGSWPARRSAEHPRCNCAVQVFPVAVAEFGRAGLEVSPCLFDVAGQPGAAGEVKGVVVQVAPFARMTPCSSLLAFVSAASAALVFSCSWRSWA